MNLCDAHILHAQGWNILGEVTGWGASCSVLGCNIRSNIDGHRMWMVWHDDLRKAGPDYDAGRMSKRQYYQVAEELLGLQLKEA